MASHHLAIGLRLCYDLVCIPETEAIACRFCGVELHLVLASVLPEILVVLGYGVRSRVVENKGADLGAEVFLARGLGTSVQAIGRDEAGGCEAGEQTGFDSNHGDSFT